MEILGENSQLTQMVERCFEIETKMNVLWQAKQVYKPFVWEKYLNESFSTVVDFSNFEMDKIKKEWEYEHLNGDVKQGKSPYRKAYKNIIVIKLWIQ